MAVLLLLVRGIRDPTTPPSAARSDSGDDSPHRLVMFAVHAPIHLGNHASQDPLHGRLGPSGSASHEPGPLRWWQRRRRVKASVIEALSPFALVDFLPIHADIARRGDTKAPADVP